MRTTYLTAIIIAVLIGLWLLSGQIGRESPPPPKTLAEQLREGSARLEDNAPTRVRARISQSQDRLRTVRVRGRTQNKRTVEVKAETGGRIVARAVERGDRVVAGDLLCRLATDDRRTNLAEARAALDQAQIEYKGALELQAKGFQSDTAIAQSRARLVSAEAALARQELDLARTRVRAPFAGLVEDVQVELGDVVASGAACATIVDLDPMLLIGRVSERDVQSLKVGAEAVGRLADGRKISGPVSFIGTQSDPATRTYPIEVRIANTDGQLKSGITTDIIVPVATVPSHRVSPALFGLNDEGQIGLRTVNDRDQVEFHLIEILSSDSDGAWVTGLPDIATIITVGQELVVPGDRVALTYENVGALPTATTPGSAGEAAPNAISSQAPQSAAQEPAAREPGSQESNARPDNDYVRPSSRTLGGQAIGGQADDGKVVVASGN